MVAVKPKHEASGVTAARAEPRWPQQILILGEKSVLSLDYLAYTSSYLGTRGSASC